MQATYQDITTLITPDMAPIVIDTGASISISPYASDFEGPLRPVQSITKRDRIWRPCCRYRDHQIHYRMTKTKPKPFCYKIVFMFQLAPSIFFARVKSEPPQGLTMMAFMPLTPILP
jgi:hypothetical protein